MSLLDQILATQSGSGYTANHDLDRINWVGGLTDPGEMLACGYLPQFRRHAGETDEVYQRRLLATAPEEVIAKVRGAAIRRANLDTTGGKVSVMTAGKVAWHGLGVNVRHAVTSSEAIIHAGQNWTTEKVPLRYSYTTANGERIDRESTESFAILRGDNGEQLGTVGKVYKPIQNVEGFAFLDEVLKQHGAKYETAGCLDGGRRVWILAHMPNQGFTVNGVDEQRVYALFANCHDGSGAAKCFPTTERVVCQNTLRLALRNSEGKKLSISHVGDVRRKVAAAKEALGVTVEAAADYKVACNTLVATSMIDPLPYFEGILDTVLEVTEAQAAAGADALAAMLKLDEIDRAARVKAYQRQIDRRKEVLEDILERYEGERCGLNGMRGTAWAALNAVTEHADHAKQGQQARDPRVRAERRFDSAMTGDRDKLKQEAYVQALDFAHRAKY